MLEIRFYVILIIRAPLPPIGSDNRGSTVLYMCHWLWYLQQQ